MSHRTYLGRTTALALLLGASPALAELTAADVWAEWLAAAEEAGVAVDLIAEQESGGVLTVTGVTMTMATPEEEGALTITLDEVVFAELGDGSVGITLSPTVPIRFEGLTPEGQTSETTVLVVKEGLDLIASGTPGSASYDYVADSVTIELDTMLLDGVPQPGTFSAVLTAVEGGYFVTPQDGMRVVDSGLAAAAFDFAADFTDPATQMQTALSASMADLVIESSSALPNDVDLADGAALFAAGFLSENAATYGATSARFEFSDPEASGSGTLAMAGGSFAFSVDAEAMGYETTSRGLEFSLSGTDLPLAEIGFTMAEGASSFLMPLAPTEEPADFALLAAYRGITLSEGVWNLFDPGATLPRDPATLVVDLAGKARWLIDLMAADEAEMAALTEPPGELNELSLNALEIAAAGASLTGTGAFTFDNADLTTFPGMPRPEGTLDLRLVGGSALIDRLVQMGLLPDDGAMGVRMMLGLFARPGDGADTLVSRIEVTPTGEVLANGQRLR